VGGGEPRRLFLCFSAVDISEKGRNIGTLTAPGGVLKLPKFIHMPNYLKEVRAELKHVSWPSRSQTIVFTIVVVAVSLFTAAYLGLWDYLFAALIKKIV
jgi:preprotein translocase subunit SecE